MLKKFKELKGNLTSRKAVGNGAAVRDFIRNQGIKGTEAAAYFWGNATQTIQDSSKGVLMAHSGKRLATTGFKATKDFSRGDPICGSLCSVAACCESVSGVIVWIPFPGKICTLSGLKAVSIGCERIRDLCAADPSNSLCK